MTANTYDKIGLVASIDPRSKIDALIFHSIMANLNHCLEGFKVVPLFETTLVNKAVPTRSMFEFSYKGIFALPVSLSQPFDPGLWNWMMFARVKKRSCVRLGWNRIDLSSLGWGSRLREFLARSGPTHFMSAYPTGKAGTVPDPIFSLRCPPQWLQAPGHQVAIVNCMGYMDPERWRQGNIDSYRQYIDTLADVSEALILKGYTLKLLTTHGAEDEHAAYDLAALLRDRLREDEVMRISIVNISTPAEIVKAIAYGALVVSSRVRVMMLAHHLCRPVLALKTSPLHDHASVPDFVRQSMLDLDSDQAATVAATLHFIAHHAAQRPQLLRLRNLGFQQWQQLFKVSAAYFQRR